jgi:thioredoxin reductase (NADPH)
MPGGQITQSSEIENYPGAIEVVSGLDLMEKWPEQCGRFGLKTEMDEVSDIVLNGDGTFHLRCSSGKEWDALSVIICTGSVPRRAGFEGEDRLFGRGVSTCATCDGFFYRGKEVVVIGGGDSALEEAHYLSKMCSKVTIVHRRESFRAAPPTIERLSHGSNIEVILNATPKEVYGEFGVDGILIEKSDGSVIDLKVPGVFIFVGRNVNNGSLRQSDGSFLCEVSHSGEVVVDLRMQTSIPGLFAAGDIRIDAPRQVVCAAGDGATAALSAISYVDSKKSK